MREHKYKVWDKQECTFLEESRKFSWHINADGSLSVSSGWNSYKEPTFEEDTDQERYLVLWFTGLKDKNGVDIYEGDICKVCFEDGFVICVVKWAEYRPSIELVPIEDKYGTQNFFWSGRGKPMDIIGNIHENPDLLQGAGDE